MTNTLKKNFAHSAFVYLFYAVSFGLPLLRPTWYGVLLAALILSWGLALKPKEICREIGSHRIVFLFLSVFIIDVLGLAYTENMEYGLSYLETKAPLVILPVIIFTSSSLLPVRIIKNILIAFVAGVLTLNLASLGFISYNLWDPKRLEANLIIANNSIVKIHPVFLSVFISFSLFFIVDTYFPLQRGNRNKLGWVLFSCIVLLVYLVWLNSRIGMLGFITALIFYVMYSLRRVQRFYAFAGMTVLIVLLLTIPFSRERFFVAPLKVLRQTSAIDVKDYNTQTLYFRTEIYRCCWELLKFPHVMYGYGTGDFKDVLLNCYAENHYTLLEEKKLDSHCEYFAQMHRNGIVGLLLFIAVLIVPLCYAMKYKSPLYGAFIILFAVTAVFENSMSSQKGVTFFSLFSPLLFLYAKENCETKTTHAGPLR